MNGLRLSGAARGAAVCCEEDAKAQKPQQDCQNQEARIEKPEIKEREQ
jgi:hypothetical protein